MEDEFLTTQEAAQLLRCSPRTLESRRSRGGGPPFAKAGDGRFASVLYNKTVLLDWLESRTRRSTTGGI